MTTPIRITIDLDNLPCDPLWPTQRQDVAAAMTIISRHQAVSDNGVGLLADWGEKDPETLWFRLPAWLQELGRYYQQHYGNQAPEVMQRVLAVLLPETTSADDVLNDLIERTPILH